MCAFAMVNLFDAHPSIRLEGEGDQEVVAADKGKFPQTSKERV